MRTAIFTLPRPWSLVLGHLMGRDAPKVNALDVTRLKIDLSMLHATRAPCFIRAVLRTNSSRALTEPNVSHAGASHLDLHHSIHVSSLSHGSAVPQWTLYRSIQSQIQTLTCPTKALSRKPPNN